MDRLVAEWVRRSTAVSRVPEKVADTDTILALTAMVIRAKSSNLSVRTQRQNTSPAISSCVDGPAAPSHDLPAAG